MLQILPLLLIAGQTRSISFVETAQVIQGPYRLRLTASSVKASDFRFSKNADGHILIDGKSRYGSFLARPTTKFENVEVFYKSRPLKFPQSLWKYYFEPHLSRRDFLDNPDTLKTSIVKGNLKATLLCGDGAIGYELTFIFRPKGNSTSSVRVF